MWEDVLETYRCLLSCRKTMPGMPLEDALPIENGSVASLEKEYAWLKQQAKSATKTVEREATAGREGS